MPQRDVSITTPDGTMDASLHTPTAPDRGRPSSCTRTPAGCARRSTTWRSGWPTSATPCCCPNFYYRLGEIEPFDMKTVFTDDDERKRLMGLVSSVTKEEATRDTEAMLDFLAEQPEVADAKVGTTGYCMGGGMALNAAGRFPDRVGAAASFHGGQIASTAPDSPHLMAGAMKATVYVAGAENDALVRRRAVRAAVRRADAGGVDHTLVTYPALHGFAVPDNPTYDEAAAARHWKALEELYGSALAPA